MTRRRLRRNKAERFGEIKWYSGDNPHTPGLPLAFTPLDGVRHRLRTHDDVERLFKAGKVSPEDLERSRLAWANYRTNN